jgi:hypothetical protein
MEKYNRGRHATFDNKHNNVYDRSMGFSCRIAKATDSHTENAINIASPRLQKGEKHASILCYTYSVYFVPYFLVAFLFVCLWVSISCYLKFILTVLNTARQISF